MRVDFFSGQKRLLEKRVPMVATPSHRVRFVSIEVRLFVYVRRMRRDSAALRLSTVQLE